MCGIGRKNADKYFVLVPFRFYYNIAYAMFE